MQFQVKMYPVAHIKISNGYLLQENKTDFFLKDLGEVHQAGRKMLADGNSSDFSGKDLSFKKKEFFHSVLSV